MISVPLHLTETQNNSGLKKTELSLSCKSEDVGSVGLRDGSAVIQGPGVSLASERVTRRHVPQWCSWHRGPIPLRQDKRKKHLGRCLHNSCFQPIGQNLAAREAGKRRLYSRWPWPWLKFKESIIEQEAKESYRRVPGRCCCSFQGLLLLLTLLCWQRSVFSSSPCDVNCGFCVWPHIFKCFLKNILKWSWFFFWRLVIS